MKSLRTVVKLALAFVHRPRDVLFFLRTQRTWQAQARPEWRARWSDCKPCLKDRRDSAGGARGHYFLQDIWAAQNVYQFAATAHVDVASRVDGFVAHVVSFKPVTYVDIRPLPGVVPGLTWQQGDVCALPFADRSLSSLSCLHVIEHIGLGRYGDTVDADGWRKGLSELQRVLAPGGQLLIGTPCGRPRVVFHAHRVFAPPMIVEALPELTLQEFSLIKTNSAVQWQPHASFTDAQGLEYGCGLFRFTRL